MSGDLDPRLKRLHLANARRVWRDLIQRAEKEEWSYEKLLLTLFSEEVAHGEVRACRAQYGPPRFRSCALSKNSTSATSRRCA